MFVISIFNFIIKFIFDFANKDLYTVYNKYNYLKTNVIIRFFFMSMIIINKKYYKLKFKPI